VVGSVDGPVAGVVVGSVTAIVAGIELGIVELGIVELGIVPGITPGCTMGRCCPMGAGWGLQPVLPINPETTADETATSLSRFNVASRIQFHLVVNDVRTGSSSAYFRDKLGKIL
jgi:hypothetical protein